MNGSGRQAESVLGLAAVLQLHCPGVAQGLHPQPGQPHLLQGPQGEVASHELPLHGRQQESMFLLHQPLRTTEK